MNMIFFITFCLNFHLLIAIIQLTQGKYISCIFGSAYSGFEVKFLKESSL